MDWFSHRTDEHFTFRRVSWPSWEEKEDYPQITGGELELSSLSDLKAVGTFDFDGTEVPDDLDMVRVYYGFTDDSNESATFPLATMFVDLAEPMYDGETVSGSLDCYSVLQVLSDKQYGMPFTVSAGTQAVQMAIQLTESLGLRVNNPDPSAYTIKSDHTFDDDASYLEIVNWLLSVAGFASCWPDAYGIVQMCEYVEPTDRPSVFNFGDDEQSIMYPEISPSSNYGSAPNVCRLYYETEEESLWAASYNVDPASKASTVSRGREKTIRETVTELAGDTTAERLANIKAMSLAKLIDNSAEIEYVDFSHAWVPLSPNDSIGIDYVDAGIKWSGAITNLRIELTESIPCQNMSRRFVRTDFKTETEGGVI